MEKISRSIYEWLLFGEYIQTNLYPVQEYQNEYIRSIYIYMHNIFYDIIAKCRGIHDLCHFRYEHKYRVHNMHV